MTVFNKAGYSTSRFYGSGKSQFRRTEQLQITQPAYGCAVSENGSGADMSVDVASGAVLVANVSVSVTATNVAITTADTTLYRIDAVVVDDTGAVSVIDGTVNEIGQVDRPDTTGYALLAYVTVPPSTGDPEYTGTITDSLIQDQRDFALIHTTPYRISGLWYGVNVRIATGVFSVSGDMYLMPFFVAKAFAAQAMAVSCTRAGTAGTVGRLGIYADDGAGGLSLFLDAGTVALDAIADPTLTIDVTLEPGWWWLAIAFQNIGGTTPILVQCNPSTGGYSPIGYYSLSQSAQAVGGSQMFTGVTGALPATPTSPDYSKTVIPMVWLQAA